MKSFSIDRFEGELAVLIDDDQSSVTVSRTSLPPEAAEGSVLLFDGKQYILDREKTGCKRAAAKKLIDELFK